MLVLEQNIFTFRIKHVCFSGCPCDVDNCDVVWFRCCRNKINADGFTRKKQQLTAITYLDRDLDICWQDIGKHNRRKIKQGVKAGLKVNFDAKFDEFAEIHREFWR